MTPPKKTESAKIPEPETVCVTVKLPKSIHAKLTAIAASESKPLTAKVVQAVREHAAKYERVSVTATTYKQKKARASA